jgi:hypothetical protein
MPQPSRHSRTLLPAQLQQLLHRHSRKLQRVRLQQLLHRHSRTLQRMQLRQRLQTVLLQMALLLKVRVAASSRCHNWQWHWQC